MHITANRKQLPPLQWLVRVLKRVLLQVMLIILPAGFIPDIAAMPLTADYAPEYATLQHNASRPDYCEAYADTFETIDELLKDGRWTDAEVMIHQVLADVPECAVAKLYLGKIHYYRRNDRQALHLFNQLAKQHPEIHQTYHFRGLIHNDRGLKTVALEEFHKVLMVNTTIGSGYFIRYILPFLEKDGRLDPVHIDSLLQHVTLPAARAMTRGFLAFYQDEYESALGYFKEVITAEPLHAGAWLYAGRCHESMRMALHALHCYNRAIAIDDTYARAYLHRGLTKINEGNWYRGCRDLRKANELEHPAADMAICNFCRRGHF